MKRSEVDEYLIGLAGKGRIYIEGPSLRDITLRGIIIGVLLNVIFLGILVLLGQGQNILLIYAAIALWRLERIIYRNANVHFHNKRAGKAFDNIVRQAMIDSGEIPNET